MRFAAVTGILFVSFAAPAAAGGIVPMPCDQTRTDDLVTTTDRDSLTFDVSAGERFYLTIAEVSGTPGFEPHVRVLDASGTEVVGPITGRADAGPLNAGLHYLEVFDWGSNATGSYRIHLQRMTAASACDNVALACDTAVAASIPNALDNDLFSFTVGTDERLFVSVPEVSGTDFDAVWRVVDASGVTVYNWTSGYREDVGPLPPSGNPYRVQVLDSAGTHTGNYRVRIQRLTGAAACDASPLGCDTLASASLADGTDSRLHTFACADGERVWIAVIRETGAGFTPAWRLLDASGAVVTWWTTGVWEDRGPLPASGSPYAVQVIDWSGTESGTYSIHLQRLTVGATCDATPLSCDVAQTGTIDTKLDSDLWTFAAVAGEMLDLSVVELSGAGFDATWRILDASGAAVVGWVTGVRDDRGPFPATGTYSLQVLDNSATATGTYLLRRQRLTAPVACEGIPVTCDVPVTRTVATVLDSDLLSFNVSDGDRVFVSVVETEGTPNFDMGWRVLDATGAAVTGRTTDARGDVGPLPASGNPYRLDLWEWGENGTGTYRAGIHRLNAATACDVTPLPCDATIQSAVGTSIDVDLFAFAASEGERVYVGVRTDAAGPNFDPAWRLIDAAGAAVTGWMGEGRIDLGPLTAAGSPYAIQVMDSAENGTGTYIVNLQRVTSAAACDAVALGCDSTLVATLDSRLDTDLYRFTVSEGELVWVAMGPVSGTTGFNPVWRVIRADGTALTGFSGTVWEDRGPFTAADSPCLVQVLDSAEDATGTYRIHLQRLTATTACNEKLLPRETSLTDSITTPLDSDLFRLVLPAEYPPGAARYSFPISVAARSAEAAGLDPVWRLIDGTGAATASCGGWASWERNCDVDAADGPFRVQVLSGSATHTGIYEITSGLYGATGVVTIPEPIPTEFGLGLAGPNPFHGTATLELAVPRPGPVRVRVFDVRGREVARVVDGPVPAGTHRVVWDAAAMPGGVYFCRMEADGFARSRKLLLVR